MWADVYGYFNSSEAVLLEKNIRGVDDITMTKCIFSSTVAPKFKQNVAIDRETCQDSDSGYNYEDFNDWTDISTWGSWNYFTMNLRGCVVPTSAPTSTLTIAFSTTEMVDETTLRPTKNLTTSTEIVDETTDIFMNMTTTESSFDVARN